MTTAWLDALSTPVAQRALKGAAIMPIVVAALLVASAGTLTYWAGWAFLADFALCSVALTVWCAVADPALLARRLRSGPAAEGERSQRAIQTVNSLAIAAMPVIGGLDRRFGWSGEPFGLVVAGHAAMLGCFAGWLLVFRHNTFAAATIEVMEKQRVIDTGPYAVVRHPMYAVTIGLLIGAPLALASYWALLPGVIALAGIVARLLHEERFLCRRLPGYDDYRNRVRWRLMPGVW